MKNCMGRSSKDESGFSFVVPLLRTGYLASAPQGLNWGTTVVDSVVNKCCISVRKCFVSVHKCSQVFWISVCNSFRCQADNQL